MKALTPQLKGTLSIKEARRIILSAQGLGSPNQFGHGIGGAKRAIEHLGYVQIDTISVIERAHNHVFWSRVKDFQPADLTQLVADKKVFEYWSRAASYLPMLDFRFSLPRKHHFASGKREWFAPTKENLSLKKMVLRRIRTEGPLTAKDFQSTDESRHSGWWDWKPAKKAIEQLFMEGHLMVSSRKGFNKIYDLTERVLPTGVDSSFPSPAEHARHLTLKAVAAHGLIRVNEVAYQRSSLRTAVEKECANLLNDGVLEELKVEGMDAPYLALRGEWERTFSKSLEPTLQILSPFDNQIIQRKRLKDIFGFDYTIECYVPEAKRKFGYFCLPLLKGDVFVGRIDAKAERANKVLSVRALHVERGCGRKSDLWREAHGSLTEFAAFNGCEHVKRNF